VKAGRIIFAAAGIALLLFGIFRLGTEIPLRNLGWLAVWLIAAIAIHDGLLSPVVVGVGWLLRRLVPDRARRYLQIALIVSGLVTVIALPMIYLRGSQPAVKAILLRNYGANLTVLVAIIAVVSLVLYAVRVARDRSAHTPDAAPTAPKA
jgi:hypothetical protein